MSKKNIKIGFMGGTFNPIHAGHTNIAECAKKQYELDEVWFVPNGNPRYKEIRKQTTRIERRKMADMTVSKLGTSVYKVKGVELNSVDFSYSYLTLNKIHEKYPDAKLYFIMGEDSLDYFGSWVKPEEILDNADILVAARSTSQKVLEKKLKKINKTMGEHFFPLFCDKVDISSTEIRNNIADGKYDMDYVDPDVVNYIRVHKLFLDPHYTLDDINKTKDKLKKKLKKARYEHTIGVMDTAAALAMKYAYPVYDAMMAGLLHDCAKYMSNEELLKYAKKHEIELTKSELAAPNLIHAKVGAYLAQNKYKVNDSDILSAITYHTTGKPEMNLLEQILFVADYIEPNRCSAPRLKDLRQIAFDNLDLATVLILSDTIDFVNERGISLDPQTVETYHYYKDKTEGNLWND